MARHQIAGALVVDHRAAIRGGLAARSRPEIPPVGVVGAVETDEKAILDALERANATRLPMVGKLLGVHDAPSLGSLEVSLWCLGWGGPSGGGEGQRQSQGGQQAMQLARPGGGHGGQQGDGGETSGTRCRLLPEHAQGVVPLAAEADAGGGVLPLDILAIGIAGEAKGPALAHLHSHIALPLAEAAGPSSTGIV